MSLKIFLICTGVNLCCMGFGHLFYSPLLSCGTWRRNGSGGFAHPGKQEATTGKGLFGNLFYSFHYQLKGFSYQIHIDRLLYT